MAREALLGTAIRHVIREYAETNGWDSRVAMRVREFRRLRAGYILPAGYTDKVARVGS